MNTCRALCPRSDRPTWHPPSQGTEGSSFKSGSMETTTRGSGNGQEWKHYVNPLCPNLPLCMEALIVYWNMVCQISHSFLQICRHVKERMLSTATLLKLWKGVKEWLEAWGGRQPGEEGGGVWHDLYYISRKRILGNNVILMHVCLQSQRGERHNYTCTHTKY